MKLTLLHGDGVVDHSDRVVFVRRGVGSRHFGNPYSHQPSSIAPVKVTSRLLAVQRFAIWLDGSIDRDLEPERRAWILKSIPTVIAGSTLICCPPGELCHAHVLAARANGWRTWLERLRDPEVTPRSLIVVWRFRLSLATGIAVARRNVQW